METIKYDSGAVWFSKLRFKINHIAGDGDGGIPEVKELTTPEGGKVNLSLILEIL